MFSCLVIIVEAAEILEAHTVTSFIRTCQHVIMIGKALNFTFFLEYSVQELVTADRLILGLTLII